MVGVGIFTLGVGKFELDLTSYLFYKCNTVVPLYCSIIRMVGRWFILFFLRFNIGRSTNKYRVLLDI